MMKIRNTLTIVGGLLFSVLMSTHAMAEGVEHKDCRTLTSELGVINASGGKLSTQRLCHACVRDYNNLAIQDTVLSFAVNSNSVTCADGVGAGFDNFQNVCNSVDGFSVEEFLIDGSLQGYKCVSDIE